MGRTCRGLCGRGRSSCGFAAQSKCATHTEQQSNRATVHSSTARQPGGYAKHSGAAGRGLCHTKERESRPSHWHAVFTCSRSIPVHATFTAHPSHYAHASTIAAKKHAPASHRAHASTGNRQRSTRAHTHAHTLTRARTRSCGIRHTQRMSDAVTSQANNGRVVLSCTVHQG